MITMMIMMVMITPKDDYIHTYMSTSIKSKQTKTQTHTQRERE